MINIENQDIEKDEVTQNQEINCTETNNFLIKSKIDKELMEIKEKNIGRIGEILNTTTNDIEEIKDIEITETQNNTTEKTEYIEDYFKLDKIESIEELKEKGEYLYFDRNKRKEFREAISNGNFDIAKELYNEALELTKDKLNKVGLTPEQNKFIVDCFRNRDHEGIIKMLNEIQINEGENTRQESTANKFAKKVIDTETGKEITEYDNEEKTNYKDPITGKEELMTRKELHERIIEKFLLEGEASKGQKQLIMSGGFPGAGKSKIEESLVKTPKVIVNPDLVKEYLPEYFDKHGRKFFGNVVHRESAQISEQIYERALKRGYNVLYDSSMWDDPSKKFPRYNGIVQAAYEQGYTIEARFIHDGGEARYRNSVIRERSLPLNNYCLYGAAYKTIKYLAEDERVRRAIIYDNSGNGKVSKSIITYENQQIKMDESDQEFIKKFNEYQLFIDKLL